ncbi:MAG: tRNA epoxyqueuosine(34) reductase QueG [Turicibacter sp.]|nr:tRNA epoxyqueuosine(34) reductase QueG [Turicibacter sp.]
MDLKAWIIAEAHKLGINKIGFTDAKDFEHLRLGIEQQIANGQASGFEHGNLDERLNPSLLMKTPKTIISVALAYPTHMKKINDGRPRGLFARASWGIDYHHILNGKMNQLIEKIREKTTTGEFKPMVDTGELIDVAVAQRAGLGFIGKNGLLITPEFGSYVYLGEILTDLELEPDAPLEMGCGDCVKCIKACPTDALLGNGQMNAKTCLSYQTQTKGVMELKYRKKIRNIIYGCDICQVVCPYNVGKDFHFHPEMEPNPLDAQPDLEELLQMGNKEFKERFGYMAGSWRGKKTLQRNAIIALANLKSYESLPLLLDIAETDPRPDIVSTAIWAIAQLKPTEAIKHRLDRLTKLWEHPEILMEIKSALEKA